EVLGAQGRLEQGAVRTLESTGAAQRSLRQAGHWRRRPTLTIGATIGNESAPLTALRPRCADECENRSAPTSRVRRARSRTNSVPAPPTIAHTTASPDTW